MSEQVVVIHEGVAYTRRDGQMVSLSLGECAQEIARLKIELDKHERLTELHWQADQRAIRRWQAEGPGREQAWPDYTDMVVWLLNKLPRSMTCEAEGPLMIPAVIAELSEPVGSPELAKLHGRAVKVIRYFQDGIELIASKYPMSGMSRSRLRYLAAGVEFKD